MQTVLGTLLLWAVGLLSPGCCESSSPDKVCSRMVELTAREGTALPNTATTACVKELEKMREGEPARWDCISKCSDKADTMSALEACDDKCSGSGGTPSDSASASRPGWVTMSLEECEQMSLWVAKKREEAGLYKGNDAYTAAGVKLFDACVADPANGKWRCMRQGATAKDIARCER